ncbi:kinase-like domain-containing protein [Xylariaceae sp. FL0016]|nr:kinase-like domain-containing protein [Xylariaceae sp. FL0016]
MAYSRHNNARHGMINRNTIIASGIFKNVYDGRYTDGQRRGQRCVAKEFKIGSNIETYYFDQELAIISRTQHIIDDWNAQGILNQRILLNTPEIWLYGDTGRKCLIEPRIENFEKFNSNTGWIHPNSDPWSEVMQALSHFSYHNSHGQLLLCDLQGGCYRDGW